MIPELYGKNKTRTSGNRIAYLPDCISCTVTEERNGVFECFMQYPVTGAGFSRIELERIISVKPNHSMSDQLFRIYRISKPMNGIVSIYAQHISYDLSFKPVMPFTESGITPSLLLSNLLDGTGFESGTNISTSKAFEVKEPKSVRACLGGSDGSVLSVWNGEFTFDNFLVSFRSERGADRGVCIEYGKNMTDLEYDSDNSTVYTDVLPYAFINEQCITLNEKTISIADPGVTVQKTLFLDLSDQFSGSDSITQAQLRNAANAYITNNGVGTLLPSITVSFEPEAVGNSILDNVNLCDTLTVRYPDYDIEAKAKVTKTVYDPLLERYESITLGNAKSSMAEALQKQIADVGKKNEHVVDRFATIMEAAINDATESITGGAGGNVVIHQDASGKPYEILIMDTDDISTAQKVWRWNSGGLGYSSNGYSGPFTTAITAQGQIVADFITTGQLTANLLKAGTIASFDNSSYWNLENGNIKVTGDIVANSLTLPSNFRLPYSKVSGTPDLTIYIQKDGTIGTTPAEGATGFKVSSAGLLQAANAVIYGKLYASGGKIANFEIAGSTLPENGFWKNTLSVVNVNSSAGKQYAAFIRGGSAHNNAVFGIKEMASTEESNSTNWNDTAMYNFYVRADGKMLAKNAEITGDITANSLTLGSGVTVPYSKISSTPDLTVYIQKDGTIGSTPADGATGFKVTSAGVLKASNAVIYGKIYASGGTIGGWDISANKITNTSASGYEVGIANFNNTDASSRVFYCLDTGTNKNVFRVNRNGHVEAADLKITGGSISIGSKFNVSSDGVCETEAMIADGVLATDAVITGLSLFGDMEMTTGSLIKMYCGNSWNIVFRYYNNAVCVGADAKVLRLCGSAAYLGSSGTTAVTSDARMKRDIAPLDEKRETFFGLLEPVNYKYNEGHRTHTGFIAQQVKEAADEAEIYTEDLAAYVNIINDDESVEHALRYEEFIALNTHMIQKLMKRVDELEQRVQELEARQ